MPAYRKLGRRSDVRMAMLRNQTTNLLWYGKITTTLDRAKEVRRMAEKLLTLAIDNYDKEVEIAKEITNEKSQTVTINVVNDLPEKLNARRKLMSVLYSKELEQGEGEKKEDYIERVSGINHPLIEKMFREYGPKYRSRNEEKNNRGGYTRIMKLGLRKGDGAEEVILELV